MKNFFLCVLIICSTSTLTAQTQKIELYDMIKKLIPDSSGYENVGDWGVGQPKQFPIKWESENLIMSEDTSINFYRRATANISIKGKTFMQSSQPVKWNFMLKGPRMGYTSYSIISSPNTEIQPKYTIDSIFGKKPFTAKLLRKCDDKTYAGYYYYEVKLPKKDLVYIKLSWISLNGNTAIRLDAYDSYSKYAVKLECPK